MNIRDVIKKPGIVNPSEHFEEELEELSGFILKNHREVVNEPLLISHMVKGLEAMSDRRYRTLVAFYIHTEDGEIKHTIENIEFYDPPSHNPFAIPPSFRSLLEKLIHERIEEQREKQIFAVPSHPLMFTLLAVFSGKPHKIPRKLLEKAHSERTPEEQQEAEEFLNSIIKSEVTGYDETGSENRTTYAMVCDNRIVEAKAGIELSLFNGDPVFREETLAHFIKRTYGPQGLRHLLGLIIGLEENQRKGYFEWEVNEHLERLGFKKKNRSYDPEAKKIATWIVRILTGLFVTATRKDKKGLSIQGERLFNIEGFEIEQFNGEIINEKLKLRATDFWYKNAFVPPDGKAPQYTTLLKKVAKENHRSHPLTIYLTPLLALWWRIGNPNQKIGVDKLFDWCNLDHTQRNGDRMRDLRNLEGELNYMKKAGYIGEWSTQDGVIPSANKTPFSCVLTLTAPEWLRTEITQIKKGKERYLTASEKSEEIPLLTKEEVGRIIHNSDLTKAEFANNLGVSRQMIHYILAGKRKISPETDKKIRDKFSDIA